MLLADEMKLAAMADGSRQIGRPDAPQRIAEVLVAMAEQYKQKMAVGRMVAGSRKR